MEIRIKIKIMDSEFDLKIDVYGDVECEEWDLITDDCRYRPFSSSDDETWYPIPDILFLVLNDKYASRIDNALLDKLSLIRDEVALDLELTRREL